MKKIVYIAFRAIGLLCILFGPIFLFVGTWPKFEVLYFILGLILLMFAPLILLAKKGYLSEGNNHHLDNLLKKISKNTFDKK